MKRELSIQEWGAERGITIVTDAGLKKRVVAQAKKLRSEFEEMVRDDDMDSLGDQYVVLSMIAALLDTTASRCRHAVREMLPTTPTTIESELNSLEWILEICDMKHDRVEVLKAIGFYVHALEFYCVTKDWKLEDCIEMAWKDIKDRKGCMISDMFVKESNLELLETHGVTVQDDSDGQKVLAGIIDKDCYDAVAEVLDSLGYKHESESQWESEMSIYTTGVV